MEEEQKQTNNGTTISPIKEVLPRQSSETNGWLQLIDNLPNDIPLAPNYNPRVPLNFTQFYITDPCRLIRRIYLSVRYIFELLSRLQRHQ